MMINGLLYINEVVGHNSRCMHKIYSIYSVLWFIFDNDTLKTGFKLKIIQKIMNLYVVDV